MLRAATWPSWEQPLLLLPFPQRAMHTFSRSRRWTLGIFSLLTLTTGLSGCREAASIKTYEAPASEPLREVVDVDEVRRGTDHMLTAIVAEPGQDSAEGKAWFFKLVARGEGLDELRKSFDEFLASVELPGADASPTWTLPKGWTEKPASGMRAATIEAPHDGKTVEIAVSSLPLSGDWGDFLQRNTARWLDQLQQPALSKSEISKLIKQKPTKAGKATFIELVGVMQPISGALSGAGQMPAGHPPIDGGTTDGDASTAPAGTNPPAAAPVATAPPAGGRPPGLPPMAGASSGPLPSEMPKPTEFTYDAPAGWTPGPMNSMRKAAFLVSEGDQRAETTVMPFPATGMMGDPIAQAERWAGQVGLTKTTDEIKAIAKPITISGMKGESFELLGPDGEAPKAILAAMVVRDDQAWFFKMFGDRPLVESQRDAFDKFIESIKFAGDGK